MDDLAEFRMAKDDFFRTHGQSPIPVARRASFTGLRYYDPNPELVVRARLEVDGGQEQVVMAATGGEDRVYTRAGTVSFAVDGRPATITLYSSGDTYEYFVPFRDATSGSETYGAGRYLEVARSDDGTVEVDFNFAYNPFCAYDESFSCPLPPIENWLDVPIRAGERTYAP